MPLYPPPPAAGGGGTIASTSNLLKGDGTGNAAASLIYTSPTTYDFYGGGTNPVFSVTNDFSANGNNCELALNNDSSAFSIIKFSSLYSGELGDTEIADSAGNLKVGVPTGKAIKFSSDAGSSYAVNIDAGLMVGTTTDPGVGIINLNTGLRIANAAGSNKILKGNGTNFVVSTETYAAPGTSGNVMTSDGTNWGSTAPTTTFVVSSGQTLTSLTLVDITGLTVTLATGTYLFSATIHGQSSSVAGVQMGINYSGTFTSADYQASGIGSTATGLAASVRGTANNTATGTFLTVASVEGWTSIMGKIVTGGSGTFSIRALKLTSGSFTIRASSWFVITKVA